MDFVAWSSACTSTQQWGAGSTHISSAFPLLKVPHFSFHLHSSWAASTLPKLLAPRCPHLWVTCEVSVPEPNVLPFLSCARVPPWCWGHPHCQAPARARGRSHTFNSKGELIQSAAKSCRKVFELPACSCVRDFLLPKVCEVLGKFALFWCHRLHGNRFMSRNAFLGPNCRWVSRGRAL